MDVQNETLPLEEQLQIQLFARGVANLKTQEAIDMLIDLYTTMKLREHCYKRLLKHKWGIEGDRPSSKDLK